MWQITNITPRDVRLFHEAVGVNTDLVAVGTLKKGETKRYSFDVKGNPLRENDNLHVYYMMSPNAVKMGVERLHRIKPHLILGGIVSDTMGEVSLHNPYNSIPGISIYNCSPFWVNFYFKGNLVGNIPPGVGLVPRQFFFNNVGDGLRCGDELVFRYLMDDGTIYPMTISTILDDRYTRNIYFGTIQGKEN